MAGFNTGTWESFILNNANHPKLIKFRESQNLPKLPEGRKAPNRGAISYNKAIKKWCVQFPDLDATVVSIIKFCICVIFN